MKEPIPQDTQSWAMSESVGSKCFVLFQTFTKDIMFFDIPRTPLVAGLRNVIPQISKLHKRFETDKNEPLGCGPDFLDGLFENYSPWEPTTLIFRGYDPGIQTFMFYGHLGSRKGPLLSRWFWTNFPVWWDILVPWRVFLAVLPTQ